MNLNNYIVILVMIRLIDYLHENLIGICEASFQNSSSNNEWIKHNYKYANNVVNYILTNKSIILGKTNEDKKIIDLSNMSNKDIELLKSLTIEKETGWKEFNSIMSKYNVVWNKIWKTPYSGGSSGGGNAEVLVCYLFNNPNISDYELEKLCLQYNINANIWIPSIKNTIKVLNKVNKWKYPDYVALQVDGKGIEYIKETSIGNLSKDDAVKIATLFYNKTSINNVLGKNVDVSKLYAKSKDEWNKADIILIKTDKNYLKEIQDKFNTNNKNPEYVGLEGFKTMCKDYTYSDIFIPISLKSTPDESAKIYTHNINIENEEQIFGVEHNGNNADVELPANKMKGQTADGDKSGSLYLCINNNSKQSTTNIYKGKKTENSFSIQFYKRSSSSNIKPTAKVELALKHSKGGSGLQQMCNALGVTTRDVYASEQRVKNGVVEYFGWDLDNLPENVKSAKNWYLKPCFSCFIGLLDLWVKKEVKNVPQDKTKLLLPFANFAIGACEGDGAYYIIK